MFLSMLSAKLHGATVTECDLHYEGSCGIDTALLEASGMIPNEEIHIWNINTGARITTYIIPEDHGSGAISLNGAAARHFAVGDKVIIASFVQVAKEDAADHTPSVLVLDDDNAIKDVKS